MKKLWFLLVIVCSFAHGIYIHPSMEEAIKQTELEESTGGRKGAPMGAVIVDGTPRHTGFYATREMYRNARVLNFEADPQEDLPKNFDFRTFSHSPVRGQVQGSCWAEGNVSAFELTLNAIMGTKLVFSVDDVIHCSGFGTARNGGYLSMEYNVKAGLAFEKDYPYTGRDGRCRQDVERHYPLKSATFLRGADGKFPTERELMAASHQFGALEVCGSASALGSGGRQDTPKSGTTNHCYAYGGWVNGKDKGYLDAVYHLIKNSWGDCDPSNKLANDQCWGDRGWGYYRLSKDGVKLLGSVITEIQVPDTGMPIVPPAPVEFKVKDAVSSFRVVVKPGRYSADKLKANLRASGYEVTE